MQKSAVKGLVVSLLLVSVALCQATAAVAPIRFAESTVQTRFAPPLNDTFPTLIPPPIEAPLLTPSYAVGEKSVIVIAVEFTNLLHTKTVQEIEQLVFTDVSGYYQEVSYGKVSLTGSVVGWYNMNRTVGAYGRDGLAIDDPNGDGSPDSWQLIQDAINVADRDVDFSQYGYVMVLHAGFGQETSGNSNDLWSCAYIWGIWFKTNDGVAFSHATIVPEDEDRGAAPFGVIAHEFGHELGLPDLYDPYGQKDYVGKFDLMSRGIWNGLPAGSSPSHPISWCKIQLGWIESNQIKTVDKGARLNVTLYPQEKTGPLLVLKVPIADRQYYLVEVRQKIGFDFALPATGVLISYVDESYGGGGKVRVVDANPLTMTADDSPFQVGQTFSDAENQIAISILWTEDRNYQVYVDRSSPQPDLAISYSGMDPQRTRAGQLVTFTFLLRNQGTLVARDFKVDLLIDGSLVKSERHTLEAGSNRVIQCTWNATLGVHKIEIKADPDDVLGEFNRGNNQALHQFIVGSILSIRLPWNNGSVKVNGTEYGANASDTVEIPVLPGQQTIELVEHQIVSPGKRLTFVRWNDGDTSNPRTYNATGDATLIPVYRTEYKLTIQPNDGETRGDGWYDEGATAVAQATSPTLLAGGKTRLSFSHWSGDADSNQTSVEFRMDAPRNITANWNIEHFLTIVSSFSSTEKQGWHSQGSVVAITAPSTVDHGNQTRRVFFSWSGDITTQELQIEVVMNAPVTVVANYRTEHELAVATEHGLSGGRRWISMGESVTISVPREIVEGETRYLFVRWEGDIQSESNEAILLMDGPKNVTGIWRTQYMVTLTLDGLPNGTAVEFKFAGEEHHATAPYSMSQWFDSGTKLTFETTVSIETVTYEYTLEGWMSQNGEWAKSPHTVNGPIRLRTVYLRRPKGLLSLFESTFGTDGLEIALLKNGRDQALTKTFAGKQLIYYFDSTCNILLSHLAHEATTNLPLRTTLALACYPLMKALTVPAAFFELGVPMGEFSFLAASSFGAAIIGTLYIFPGLTVLAHTLRRRASNLLVKSLKQTAIIWTMTLQVLVFGIIVASPLVVATSAFIYLVLTAIVVAIIEAYATSNILISIAERSNKTQWSAKSLSEQSSQFTWRHMSA